MEQWKGIVDFKAMQRLIKGEGKSLKCDTGCINRTRWSLCIKKSVEAVEGDEKELKFDGEALKGDGQG